MSEFVSVVKFYRKVISVMENLLNMPANKRAADTRLGLV
jgi:hypothetical protein